MAQHVYIGHFTLRKCTGLFNNKGDIFFKQSEKPGNLDYNITEDYLFRLISDIKPIDDGRIYIIGSDGNYVLNPYDRSKNGKKADLEFVEDMLRKGENVDIKEIMVRSIL